MVNPSHVLPDHRPYKGGPEILGVARSSLQAPGQAGGGVGSPGGDTGQQAHHLAAQGEFQGQLLIGEGRVPVGRAGGLDVVPAEGDEGPADPQIGGCPGSLMGGDDAEAGVGRNGGSDRRYQQSDDKEDHHQRRDQESDIPGISPSPNPICAHKKP